jgi:hypothetical protein
VEVSGLEWSTAHERSRKDLIWASVERATDCPSWKSGASRSPEMRVAARATRQRVEVMLGGREGRKVTRGTRGSTLPMVVQPRGVRRVSVPVEETLMTVP